MYSLPSTSWIDRPFHPSQRSDRARSGDSAGSYEKRTPKSAAGTSGLSNASPLELPATIATYEPYPIFVKDGKAGRIHDVDGNEYIDHNLCFGALMAGHCHPAVVKAVEQKLH